MLSKHHPHNHLVSLSTLNAIRNRHPLALQAMSYGPGRWEIGHGCRGGIYAGLRISPAQAEDLFRSDIMFVESAIRCSLDCALTDAAYQALVSYLFDVGPSRWKGDDVHLLLQAGKEEEFFRLLPALAGWSRFNEHVGRAARFFEVSHKP